MTQWFVRPATARVALPDGEWIEVKQRLTIGEERRQQASVIKEVRTDGRVTPDLEMLGKAETLAYLVEWSLRDEDGRVVRIDTDARKSAAIDSLSPEAFRLISEAITAHVERMAAERDVQKNVMDGVNALSTTSPSVG